MAGLSVLGKERFGIYALRGKFLNVKEATKSRIQKNQEIQDIVKIMGLEFDKEYENTASLRYGHIMFLTDQDEDGAHIKGLLICFFHTFWHSLLKCPSFISQFITPVIKVTSIEDNSVMSFYSIGAFETWRPNIGGNMRAWAFKYYKGIATHTAEEMISYFEDIANHRKVFSWVDERDDESIDLAFSKNKISKRKEWMLTEKVDIACRTDDKISFREFINTDLLQYALSNLERSIPCMIDGLKLVQRKVLFCSFMKDPSKEVKVHNLSSFVSQKSVYHHGEKSLDDTIIRMSQNFVGKNNINLFLPLGQFGTRNMVLSHLSNIFRVERTRHSHDTSTLVSPIARTLFHQNDDSLLNFLNQDGEEVQPQWYMPIIPMVLVNGSSGIGTGWSSFVPQHKPSDVISNLRRLLNGQRPEPMVPWYKGFKGSITTNTTSSGVIHTSAGSIQEVNDNTLRITELPIGYWIEDCKNSLRSMCRTEVEKSSAVNRKRKNQVIIEASSLLNTGHDNNIELHFGGDCSDVDIEIKLGKEHMLLARENGLLDTFKLTRNLRTNNMHLLDANGKIKKYGTTLEILQEFYDLRIEFYKLRKEKMQQFHELKIKKLNNEVRFILCTISGEIKIPRRKAKIVEELIEKGFDAFTEADSSENVAGYEYLTCKQCGDLSEETVDALREVINGLEENLECVRNTEAKEFWLRELEELEKELDVDHSKKENFVQIHYGKDNLGDQSDK